MIIDSPHLLTGVVKEHAAKTVKKGIEIFINFKEKISVVHSQSNEISLKIPSQTRNKYYNVKLETEHGWIDHYCNCPAYEDCFECKHVVAACLYLLHEQYQLNEEETIELLETDNETDEFFLILEAEKRREQNSLRVVNADDKPLPALSSKINQWKEFTCKGALSLYSIQQYCYYWPVSADHQKIKLTGFDQAIRHWTFAFQQTKSEIYHPEIKYDAQHTYHYRCDCQNKTKYRMCRHVLVAFARLLDGGEKFFLQYRDWTIEKNKLLQPYGLSLQDDEAKFFQFNLDYYNELKLTVPAGFYKSGDIDGLKKLSAKLRVKNNSNELISRPVAAYGTVID